MPRILTPALRDQDDWLRYYQKILRIEGLIGYWPLWEPPGVPLPPAHDLSGVAGDGVYQGVTLGQPGIGDRRTSVGIDGINDYVNVFTVPFQTAFAAANDPNPVVDVAEGTVAIWAMVDGPGVWVDGAGRYLIQLRADAANRISLSKSTAPNQLNFSYRANNISSAVNLLGVNTVAWFEVVITWSASTGPTGEVRGYFHGIQIGITRVALGTWAGNLANGPTNIGCDDNTVPTNVWHGNLAHGFVLNRAASPEEVAYWAEV